MRTSDIPFQTIDWEAVPKSKHEGEQGYALWQSIEFDGLRMRTIEYSVGYIADHWCRKGHIVYCLEGSFTTELSDGTSFELKKGMSYIVSDELSSHRSTSATGVKLFIIDGDFLHKS